jgi:Arc/MetJ-type ribon-helix-helix transcriptional regulator
MSEYNHVRIPKAIAERIQEIAIKSGMYRNVSEFVIEATRNQLKDLDK